MNKLSGKRLNRELRVRQCEQEVVQSKFGECLGTAENQHGEKSDKKSETLRNPNGFCERDTVTLGHGLAQALRFLLEKGGQEHPSLLSPQ